MKTCKDVWKWNCVFNMKTNSCHGHVSYHDPKSSLFTQNHPKKKKEFKHNFMNKWTWTKVCKGIYKKNTQMIFYFIELKCENMEIKQSKKGNPKTLNPIKT
jgi:hypothetical protein